MINNTPAAQAHKAFELIVREHPQPVLLISPDTGQIVYASDKALVFYGWTMNELRQMTLEDLYYSDDLDLYADYIEAEYSKLGEDTQVRFVNQRDKFGVSHPVRLTPFKLMNEAASLKGILVCQLDKNTCLADLMEEDTEKLPWYRKTDEPRRALLQNDLRKGLKQSQFYLAYQPIIDVHEKKIAGFEALLRWQHPIYGQIMPREIFDLHFPGSFLVELDCFVIEEALKTLAHLRKDQFIHVNFEASNLKNQSYLKRLGDILSQYESYDNRLVLDFNDSIEMLQLPAVKKLLEEHHLMFAIENIGSGVIPLAEILKSRIHTLNLDMHLVTDMGDNYANAVVINAILKIAKTMNLDAIAKGVEKPEQYRYLVKNGCRYIQGFLLGKPAKMEEAQKLETNLAELLANFSKERQEDNYFGALENNEAVVMIELDDQRRLKHVPEQLATWLGFEPRELLDKPLVSLIRHEEREVLAREFEAVEEQVYFNDALVHLIDRTGSEIFVSISGQRAAHAAAHCIVYIENLSYLEDEGQIFISAQNSYKTIFNESPFGIMIMNEDRECIDWNKKAEEMFGWSKSEVYRKAASSIFPNVSPKLLNKILRESLAEDLFVVSVNENIRKDGRIITCRWHNKAIVDAKGQIRLIISMAEDITDSIEKDLIVKRLSLAMDLTESMVVVLSDKGSIRSLNEPMARTMGWEQREVMGKSILRLLDSDMRPTVELAAAAIRRGEIWKGETGIRIADGEMRMFRATVCPVTEDLSNEKSVVVLLNDLSDERLKELQFSEVKKLLSEQEKLATIGSMLTGIIHEINNPLSYIDTNLIALKSMLSEVTFPPEVDTFEIEDILKDINTGVQHIKAISASLKRMAFKGLHEEEEYFDINEEIETVLNVAKNEYKYYAFVTYEKENELFINGYPSGVRQVMLNLLINATHAIRKRYETSMGNIKVVSRKVDGFVEVRVSDNGTGIPESIRESIFETFFTTKKKGEGTGLGLSISKSIIEEKHHGVLTFESVEGEGTTFIIKIPEGKMV